MKPIKLILYMAGFLLILIVGAVLVQGGQLLSMGSAYKSKMLCSEMFVAGREQEAVLHDLVIDDLSALKNISSNVVLESKTVTSNFYGLAKSKVQYREHVGCAVVSDDVYTIPALERASYAGSESSLESQIVSDDSKLSEVVSKAFDEINSERLRRTRAVVILHKGKIIAERYSDEVDKDTPMLGWSMTKSVMNALVGILVKRGDMTLDSSIGQKAWSSPNDPRQSITVRHLLNMTSGLKFNEEMTDPLADVSRMILQEPNMAEFSANMPLEVEPGSQWNYSSGNSILLSDYIRRVLGDDEYFLLPEKYLFEPLQMTRSIIESDASGTLVGSSYMYATAREWAKFGLLYLQNGIWQGEQLFPDDWLDFTLAPAPSIAEKNYGAHFWLDLPQAYRGADEIDLPKGTFHAIGHEGQFITVVPSHDVVIVRLGKTRYSGVWQHDVFVKQVLTGLPVADEATVTPHSVH